MARAPAALVAAIAFLFFSAAHPPAARADHHRPGEGEPRGRTLETPEAPPGREPAAKPPGLSGRGEPQPVAPRAASPAPVVRTAAPASVKLRIGERDGVEVRLSGDALDELSGAEVVLRGRAVRAIEARLARGRGGEARLRLALTGEAAPGGDYRVRLLGAATPVEVPLRIEVIPAEAKPARAGSARPTPPPTAKAPDRKAPPTGPLAPAQPAPAPTAANVPGQPIELVVRVEDGAGQPIAGAWVCLRDEGPPAKSWSPKQANGQGEVTYTGVVGSSQGVPLEENVEARVSAAGFETEVDEVDVDDDEFDEDFGGYRDTDTVTLSALDVGETDDEQPCGGFDFEIPPVLEGEAPEGGPQLEAPDGTYEAQPSETEPEEDSAAAPETDYTGREDAIVVGPIAGMPGQPSEPGEALPDVTVSVSQSPPNPITQGQAVSYTVEVANLGNVPATDLTFDANLPPGLTYVSNSTVTQFTCEHQSTQSRLRCGGGALQAGLTSSVVILMQVPPDTAAGESVTFGVVSDPSGALDEADESNNTASLQTQVVAADEPLLQSYGPLFSGYDDGVTQVAYEAGFGFAADEDGCKLSADRKTLKLPMLVAGGESSCTFRIFQGRNLAAGWRITNITWTALVDDQPSVQAEWTDDWTSAPGGAPGAILSATQTNDWQELVPGLKYNRGIVLHVTLEGPVGAAWQDAFE